MSFELERVDLRVKKLDDGRAFAEINPKEQIPALQLPDGQVLTEGGAIAQYIADLDPSRGLAPPWGTLERVRLQEWLNFIATELHKQIAPIIKKEASDEYAAVLRERVSRRLEYVAGRLANQTWLMGDTFTVADGYLFYILRTWQRAFNLELPAALVAYYRNLVARPSVKAALLAEGLQP